MIHCNKCGSIDVSIRPNKKNPNATDLFCVDCGAWLKFANKDEVRAIEYRTNNHSANRYRDLLIITLNELKLHVDNFDKKCEEIGITDAERARLKI